PPHNRHVSRLDRRASEPGARSLRLVGGGGRCAGRVEVKHRGEWGSSASSTSTGKRLGPGGVPAAGLWPGGQGVPAYPGQAGHGADLAPALLLSAPRMRWRRLFWSIQGSAAPCGCPGADAVELRLAGGGSPCAGRVEVKLQGRWGSVADENWDMEDAEVVCRELGCGVALGIPGSGRFGVGSGMLWEGGFQCNGSEPLLSACAQRAPHGQGCSGPASVICSRKCRGQRGGTWGSVCAAEWDLPDAHVLCRHLGCGRAFSVPPGGSLGGGEGPLRPDAFGCSGSERHPGECPVAVLGKGPCAPGNAAAVNCSGVCGTRGRSLKGFWNSPRIGIRGCRVVLDPGLWLCARRQPAGEAGGELWALCRAGGGLFQRLVEQRVPGRLGAAGRRRCVPGAGLWHGAGGPEAGALRCRHGAAVAVHPRVLRERGVSLGMRALGRARLRSGGGAGAVCSGEWRAPPDRGLGEPPGLPGQQLSVRLAGGRGRCRGYLEVSHNGTWGRVCANGTSPGTAGTVCRQLGCGDSGSLWADPARQPAPAWLAWLGCEDGARSLWVPLGTVAAAELRPSGGHLRAV
uniref:SRCR domain-containing protein n=1 Tax=Malurus cyaneus samueli TaxID=2593467 RepID=A0A8C5UHA0_9PASS